LTATNVLVDEVSNPAALAKIYKRELYMIREACIGIMLQHPNIVKLHSAVLGENHFYCFFELVDGEDLVDYISRNGKMSETISRDIFRQVLSAIGTIAINKIMHTEIM
jgi:serine/threonine protein kinase